MEISEINKNDLELKCVGIITQCLADLGQKDNDAENKVMLAQKLAKDLKKRYSFMPFDAVVLAFENGVRDSELFVICPATWCKWLNKMRAEIWDGWHHFELGNFHVIQPHVKQIMKQQPLMLMEYKKKKLSTNNC